MAAVLLRSCATCHPLQQQKAALVLTILPDILVVLPPAHLATEEGGGKGGRSVTHGATGLTATCWENVLEQWGRGGERERGREREKLLRMNREGGK